MKAAGTERERPSGGARLLLLFASTVLLVPCAAPAAGQETGWTGRLFLRAQSVEDRRDWLRLRQVAARRLGGGRRLEVGLVQVRRFDDWDAGLSAGGTVRPGGGTFVSADARVTPDADVLEDLRAGARISRPVGDVVPSLGYRAQLFDEGTVHTVSPRLNWYLGPWLLSGEVRVIRSAVETVNVAAIGRVTRRLSPTWSVQLGVARGEEDFLVGRPPDQRLRTLTTRSLSAGAEHELAPGWSLRLNATLVDSDPTLDRAGGSLLVTRSF